ncbi:hypothetical protein [Jannaschia rubra]|nr:hypothetical protein [Jannaschia rubra]
MDDLYDSVFCNNVDVNYRVLSVLTAAGAYHDQRKAWLKGKEYREEIEKVFSIEYDKKLSYRIIEILRNHAKHQDLPIGNILYDSSNKYQHPRPEGASRLREAIEPRVVISELIKNGRLKSATRTEVGNIDKGYICLKSLLRNYAASMARGHEKVRQQTSDALTAAKNEIDAAHHRFQQEFPGEEKRSEYFLGATTTDVHGEEEVHVGKVFYRRLDRARAQFQGLESFERFYVSSEMIDNPETYYCDVGEVLRD